MRELTPLNVMLHLVGSREMKGEPDNPWIVAMIATCKKEKISTEELSDEIPWCSAYVNTGCVLAGYRGTGSLRARSWLRAGREVNADDVRRGDIAVLGRGRKPWPGKNVVAAPGHVGFVDSYYPESATINLLAGNQGNKVSFKTYALEDVLAFRRLSPIADEDPRPARIKGAWTTKRIDNLERRLEQLEGVFRHVKEVFR